MGGCQTEFVFIILNHIISTPVSQTANAVGIRTAPVTICNPIACRKTVRGAKDDFIAGNRGWIKEDMWVICPALGITSAKSDDRQTVPFSIHRSAISDVSFDVFTNY